MKIERRAEAFARLGKKIKERKADLVRLAVNPWFTKNNVLFALDALAESLSKDKIYTWLKPYNLADEVSVKNIAVIAAGNIPLVVFHDFLSVLISGHRFVGKLSRKDDRLLPAVINLLTETEPEFARFIRIEKQQLRDFDAVIATGSDNSARYFEAYFGKYPHIIRKNRYSAAILTGEESDETLRKLSDDMFLYFGLGCRNVSKLFLPEGFDINRIFKASVDYADYINHNKYANNYDYNRAIFLMDKQEFFDNGFVLMKESLAGSSPVSVIFYEYYKSSEALRNRVEIEKDKLQCIVGNHPDCEGDLIEFGSAQKPELWDYADNIDTLNFLT